MNTKLMIGLCCALVIGLAPLGTAHLTNGWGSWTSGLYTQGKVCRYGGSISEQVPPHPPADQGPCEEWLNSGVSGSYVGPSGFVLQGDAFPITVNPDLVTICPAGFCAAALMLCDVEVLSAGTTDVGDFEDEQVVDNDETDGLVPDGTWDDGGFGGACHTSHYDRNNFQCDIFDPAYDRHDPVPNECASFNTYQCGGTSHAQDLLSAHNVWILAACDYQTVVTEDLCTVSELLAGPTPEELQECLDRITCLAEPDGCDVAEVLTCEADGSADAANLGQGGGHFFNHNKKLPSGLGTTKTEKPKDVDGVPYPRNECPLRPDPQDPTTDHATAATFVLVGVDVKAGTYLNDGVSTGDPDGDGPLGPASIDTDGKPKEHQALDGVGEAVYSLLLTLAKKPEFAGVAGELAFVAGEFYNLTTGLPDIKYSIASVGWIDWSRDTTQLPPDEDKDGTKVTEPVGVSPLLDEVLSEIEPTIDEHTPDCATPIFDDDNEGDGTTFLSDPGCTGPEDDTEEG
ncbi:MAG TPA: hypothetical protein VHI93_00165 [Candidatus Thermoplasmatota archaeon]|nr:hypothetical protein [Candidatus Thermoplasmatota archaeon]